MKQDNASQLDLTPLLHMKEVADILGICQSFAYRLVQRGDLPGIHMGRSVRVHPKVLHEFMQQNSSKEG